jgi:hypothetical protein
MKDPLFSIVLPTKNRPELRDLVIQSIQDQDFGDWELVVAENSEELSPLPESAQRDSRVRLLRTGGLSLPDNYEAGYAAASGQYALLGNDKTLWFTNALSLLSDCLGKFSPDYVTWIIGAGFTGKERGMQVEGAPEPFRIESPAVLQYAASCRIDLYQRYAPRANNCAIRRSLLDTIRNGSGRICPPVSPDYTLSASVLCQTSQGMHLPVRLAAMIAGIHANTHRMLESPSPTEGYYATLSMQPDEFLREVPVRTFLINNLLLDDILATVRRTTGKPLVLNTDEYPLMLLSDLALAVRDGRSCRVQAHEVRQFLRNQNWTSLASFLCHSCGRFLEGWPDRKKTVRDNLPSLLLALRALGAAR